jgi:hypothetical protein
VGLDHRLAYRHRGRISVQLPLQQPTEHAAEGRTGEPRVERRHHGQIEIGGSQRRHQTERRVEASMHVDDVDPLALEELAETAPEVETGSDPGERTGAINGSAGTDPPHERGIGEGLL